MPKTNLYVITHLLP